MLLLPSYTDNDTDKIDDVCDDSVGLFSVMNSAAAASQKTAGYCRATSSVWQVTHDAGHDKAVTFQTHPLILRMVSSGGYL